MIDRVAARLPLSAWQRILADKIVGLTYHMVSDELSPAVRHLYPYKSPDMFEQDLLFVRDHCRALSYEQLLDSARPPMGSVFLTFDDGYRECVSVVRPLLLKHGIPCMFFIVSDFVDNRRLFFRNKVSLCIEQLRSMPHDALADAVPRLAGLARRAVDDRGSIVEWLKGLRASDEPVIDEAAEILRVDWMRYLHEARPFMTTEEIRLLASDGFTIGAHSRTHPYLGELQADEVEEEIVTSCRRIREITGQQQVPFAFPFSAQGVDAGLLSSLKARFDLLGPLFDCRGLRARDPLLIDRLWADPPAEPGTRRSNLDSLLKQAYREYVRA